jgi:hypothetical protein
LDASMTKGLERPLDPEVSRWVSMSYKLLQPTWSYLVGKYNNPLKVFKHRWSNGGIFHYSIEVIFTLQKTPYIPKPTKPLSHMPKPTKPLTYTKNPWNLTHMWKSRNPLRYTWTHKSSHICQNPQITIRQFAAA